MSDPFKFYASGLTSPGRNAAAVTPSDVADLASTARAFYVGGAGDVKLTTANGDTVTLVGLAAGIPIPITAQRIFATGTTATSIVAIW